MKKSTLFGLLLLFAMPSYAQINALTETGDAVILYENGQWEYVEEPTTPDTIPINRKPFIKDEAATFLVKSKKIDAGVSINPKEWVFQSQSLSPDAEFSFLKKGKEIYAVFISESVEIPVETLGQVALLNAKSMASDAKVVKQEYRNVNGVDVLMMQMAATIQGIKFKYFGYYFSSEKGSLQLLTWTYDSLFDKSEKEIETFLNGFVQLVE